MKIYPVRFRFRLSCMALFAAIFLFLWPAIGSAQRSLEALSADIQKRFEAARESQVMLCGETVVYAPSVLQELYGKRQFEPAWINSDGPLPQAEELLLALSTAGNEGLKPAEYHLAELISLISAWRSSRTSNMAFPIEKRIDLEFLLTDAFVTYGFHLLNGRVDPESLYPDWVSPHKDSYLGEVIETAMRTGEIGPAVERLLPRDTLYRDLKKTLAAYIQIAAAGGWPTIPPPRSAQGMTPDRRHQPLVRQRLILAGDLSPTEATFSRHDADNLRKAVRKFQKRHGLKADGVISKATLKEMNIPVEKRIRQIRLNMERLRWLPDDIGRQYILVNIADFELDVMEGEKTVMSMPIVVGKQTQRTNVFSGKMTYIELNPYWNIPKTIAAKEILPKVQQDPTYLKKKNIKVIEYRRKQEKEVDPEKIEWRKILPDKLKYSFRQDFGPGNALGRIKFMFPNKFDVYLHDTPERHLFKRTQRTFSHGCIRIAKPIDLAEYLLKNENGWNRKKILAEIGKGKRQILKLKDPIDVHILYLTAWVDRQGVVQFRNDIYKGDDSLLEALSEKPRTLIPEDTSHQELPGAH